VEQKEELWETNRRRNMNRDGEGHRGGH
jgi:hypothetical protein